MRIAALVSWAALMLLLLAVMKVTATPCPLPSDRIQKLTMAECDARALLRDFPSNAEPDVVITTNRADASGMLVAPGGRVLLSP